MAPPTVRDYVGIESEEALLMGVAGFVFAATDVTILEELASPDSETWREYSHMLEHVMLEDIKMVAQPSKYASLYQSWRRLQGLPPHTDEWHEEAAGLHGQLLGTMTRTILDYGESRKGWVG